LSVTAGSSIADSNPANNVWALGIGGLLIVR
jgi:hypothetical protein